MTDNPLAFSRPGFGNPAGYEDGMTLRDYFAAKALPAVVVATSSGQHHPIRAGSAEKFLVAAMAHDSYELADAMLAERLK